MKVKIDVKDLATMCNEISFLTKQVNHNEQHLRSCENALMEKDNEIKRLKKEAEEKWNYRVYL